MQANNLYSSRVSAKSYASVEGLSSCGETVGSEGTSVVYHTHRFVSLVAWDSDLIILHYVLFDYGLTRSLTQTLDNGSGVQVSLG